MSSPAGPSRRAEGYDTPAQQREDSTTFMRWRAGRASLSETDTGTGTAGPGVTSGHRFSPTATLRRLVTAVEAVLPA